MTFRDLYVTNTLSVIIPIYEKEIYDKRSKKRFLKIKAVITRTLILFR